MTRPDSYVRRYHCGDPFWDDGDVAAAAGRKLAAFDYPAETALQCSPCVASSWFSCNQPGCTKQFSNIRDYEEHNAYMHTHRCNTCQAAFPSARLLDMHLSEAHDAFFQAMSQRQPMYACLVEGCGKLCPSDRARRRHLIEVHSYPRSFRFHRRQRQPQRPGEAQARASERKKKKKRACRYFLTARGCDAGEACAFSHDPKIVAAAGERAARRAERRQKQGEMNVLDGAGAEATTDVDMDDVTEVLKEMRIGAVPATLSFGRQRRRR